MRQALVLVTVAKVWRYVYAMEADGMSCAWPSAASGEILHHTDADYCRIEYLRKLFAPGAFYSVPASALGQASEDQAGTQRESKLEIVQVLDIVSPSMKFVATATGKPLLLKGLIQRFEEWNPRGEEQPANVEAYALGNAEAAGTRRVANQRPEPC